MHVQNRGQDYYYSNMTDDEYCFVNMWATNTNVQETGLQWNTYITSYHFLHWSHWGLEWKIYSNHCSRKQNEINLLLPSPTDVSDLQVQSWNIG